MAEFYEEENYLEILAYDRAIIEWDTFSIEADEVVKFLQPGDKAVVTNRIIGGEASEIHGRMEANGKLYFINPQGLEVDETAEIHAGNFLR